MVDKVHGYSLFNEIEDRPIQTHNRAIVLANIVEDNLYPDGRVTQGGMTYSLEYMDALPKEDYADVYLAFRAELVTRRLLSVH